MSNVFPMDSKLQQHYIISAIALVIVGGLAFAGGVSYQRGKTVAPAKVAALGLPGTAGGGTTRGGYPGGGGFGGGRRGGAAGGFVNGQITAKNGDVLTIQDVSGASSNLIISTGTTISKTTTGTLDDLAIGDTITAAGSEGSDGSLDATTIQIRPEAAAPLPGGATQ